jgi:hypothetical protein
MLQVISWTVAWDFKLYVERERENELLLKRTWVSHNKLTRIRTLSIVLPDVATLPHSRNLFDMPTYAFIIWNMFVYSILDILQSYKHENILKKSIFSIWYDTPYISGNEEAVTLNSWI